MKKAIVGAVAIAAALTGFTGVSASAATIRIPEINVSAPLVPGDPTHNIHKVFGKTPSVQGSSVLQGHSFIRSGKGRGGVFDRLPRLTRGDKIFINKEEFVVTKKMAVSPARYRKLMPKLHSLRGPRRVALVTCTNRDNSAGVYRTRTVVIARYVAQK